ncbi:MAG TPA: Gfo/Idh/MocA family oxidoreductase [Anaerolineaceae bacterium]|nr:Gfo/Idh/MocA family oxidoreductase [Anaerolineaceae bacterium]
MSDKILRWGVLSTANIGRVAVCPAIQASANGELLAVGSRSAGKAQAFAEALGIPRAYGSYEALLADPELGAVYIALPNSLHKEWAIRAAEAGKHILCEKPLALNAGECLEMNAAARANGVQLMEAFMYRFHPRTAKVLDVIRTGALGPLEALEATFTFRLRNPENIRYNRELGGGALMDVGCYCVNWFRTAAGRQPVEVCAWANWAETGVDRNLIGMLRFEGGLLAHFTCSLSAERRETCLAAGQDAYLEIPAAFLPGAGPVEYWETRDRQARQVFPVDGADEYRLMVEHFADCVQTGRPPRYSPLEAAENMQVIAALLESARSDGRPVRVAPITN